MKSTLKTTLVNHSGVIQDKFIIRNIDDLYAYEPICSQEHTTHLLDMSDKPSSIHKAMIQLSDIRQESMLMTSVWMSSEKIKSIQKQILAERVVVVSLSGGWNLWDDETMSIVDESERKLNDSEYLPKVTIGQNKVLIIENQEEISKHIQLFVEKELKQTTFSSIMRLNTDYNNQIGEWIGEALKNGCDTIVAETQLMNKSQIQKFAGLFEKMPPITFHILTQGDLIGELMFLIGEEKTNLLLKKHNIVIRKPY